MNEFLHHLSSLSSQIKVRHHLPLQRAGEVGDLLYRLLNIADALYGHLKSSFIILALGFEITELLLQIGPITLFENFIFQKDILKGFTFLNEPEFGFSFTD